MTKKSKVSGTKVHFILLRGLARDARHWGALIPTLEKAASKSGDQAVVDAIDLPGAGRYSEMKSPISISEITEFVRAKYNEIKARRRDDDDFTAQETYIVAMSLGGMVAADWLENRSSDFTGAVLVNTSFRGYSPVLKRLPLSAVGHMLKIIAESRDDVSREKRVLEMVSNRSEIYDRVAAEWAQYARLRPMSAENSVRQLVAAATFSPSSKAPAIPVLVLVSERDRMVDPSCSEVIAKRWHAEIQRHPTAGHDLPLDAPEWVVEQIISWRASIT